MKKFESLAAFATEDRIIRLIAKERGKYTAKVPERTSKKKVQEGKPMENPSNPFARDNLFNELKSMTPPHRFWACPERKLPPKADRGLARWTCRKKRASIRIYQAIRKHKDRLPDEPWVQNLNAFVSSIQDIVAGRAPLTLETPRILSKYKEQDPESGDFIYRPICKYSDLTTKVVLALTYRYIVTCFDSYFHDNMLFMRSARRAGEDRYVVPNFLDAIDMVSDFRRTHDRENIYVGECDIQKFYDIFHHDVILASFEDLFDEAKRERSAEDADFDPLRAVLKAYLDSFNYPHHVMDLNAKPGQWRREQNRHRNARNPEPVCRFKWVKEEALVSSGCYSEQELVKARDGGKLGIPQGGALSGIIVNVVMRMVDKPIVEVPDPNRLFIRYCDDILLMHTDRKRCEAYLDTYYQQLIRYKLLPHPRKDVSSFKDGEKTRAGFWHAKSKNVYRWGPGEGDASDWVAFVGYEMRRTGEIRIRKDKIDLEFKRIAKKYFDVILSKPVQKMKKEGAELSLEEKEEILARMDGISKHILDYEKAGNNVYTRSQARRLDKYLIHKARKAARKIGLPDDKGAARACRTYSQYIREKEDGNI